MKIKALFITIVGVLIVTSLCRSLKGRYQRAERLEELQKEVTELEEKHTRLEKQKAEAESEVFLEREARDKLQMVKQGEKVVILPENVVGTTNNTKPEYKEYSNTEAVWRQWIGLFFSG